MAYLQRPALPGAPGQAEARAAPREPSCRLPNSRSGWDACPGKDPGASPTLKANASPRPEESKRWPGKRAG